MISCFFNKKKISALIDGEIPERRHKRLIKHVSNCESCGSFLKSLQKTDHSVGEYFNAKRETASAPVAGLSDIKLDSANPEIRPEQVDMSFIMVLKAMLRIPEEEDSSISISTDGSAEIGFAGKYVPAILLILAILLFYAPTLEAFYQAV